MTDEGIVALFFDRNESAITETKATYGTFFRRIIYAVVRCNEDTDECESDTYLKIWNAIPPEMPTSLKYLGGRIARNSALDCYRKSIARKRALPESVPLETVEDFLSITDTDYDTKLLGEAIDGFLRTISAEKRIVFIRKYWFFDTIDEISVRLGISESKVKSMLMRTRTELHKHLEKEGFTL